MNPVRRINRWTCSVNYSGKPYKHFTLLYIFLKLVQDASESKTTLWKSLLSCIYSQNCCYVTTNFVK